jgi:hypothetical protein
MSAPFCDGRQTGYKESNVIPKIYTPAVVINGDHAVKGNDSESVIQGLNDGRTETVADIRLTVTDGYLNITMPNVAMSRPADVWFFAYNTNHAVTNLTKLMQWNGKSVSMAFPVQNLYASGYAVVAQTSQQTNIVAAGKTN